MKEPRTASDPIHDDSRNHSRLAEVIAKRLDDHRSAICQQLQLARQVAKAYVEGLQKLIRRGPCRIRYSHDQSSARYFTAA